MKRRFAIFALVAVISCSPQTGCVYDVIVAGGSASGVCAGIQPYLDLEPSDPDFKALQRTGSMGMFRAEGSFAAPS